MSSRNVTMKTVAEAAGVCMMTVSRALRDQPCLPLGTRRRIQAMAKEMGYRPNPLVSTLMAQLHGRRTKRDSPVICYVTAYAEQDHWKELPYTLAAYNGAAARAEELGYRLEHFWLAEPGMTGARANRILRVRGITGLVVAPLPAPQPAGLTPQGQLNINWDSFASASIGLSLHKPLLHRSVVDHVAAMRLAYRSLVELGYRRIGLALRPVDDNQVENKWISGYYTEQHFTPSKDRVPLHLEADWRQDLFLKWFRKHRPDVVLTMHREVISWIEEAGFGIPGDVGVAMPDISYATLLPGLSGINQQTEVVGALALDLVVEQIHHNQRGIPRIPKMVMVQGHWVQGTCVRRQQPQDHEAVAAALPAISVSDPPGSPASG
ncbi:MAG TPA: LacI family DNA-binding transcriptional regulator, partial [Candidatus Methylacidiphilales bacterium]|nr:LacI family DNA-binding transcriptional regulator [Candidatus Methylacidiphilales bacterium]